MPSAVNRSTTCAGGKTGASCGGDVGGSGWADAASINGAMASTAPAAPAARWRKFRRKSFIFEPPFTSFDHLVGAGENRVWHGQAEGLGGLEIDDELEPGRQLDRQLARLGTLEDAIDIGGRTPVAVGEVLAVADQSSGLYVLPEREDRRQPVLERELRDSLALLDEK